MALSSLEETQPEEFTARLSLSASTVSIQNIQKEYLIVLRRLSLMSHQSSPTVCGRFKMHAPNDQALRYTRALLAESLIYGLIEQPQMFIES